MSKRKLSRQQYRRIEKIQNEQARNSEKAVDTQIKSGRQGPERTGQIIAHYGTQVDIVDQNTHENFRCYLRANLPNLVTGDHVVWQKENKGLGVLVARLPRKSELCRPDDQGNLRPIAANIDLIFVVVAPKPELCSHLINQYLVAAEVSNITPIILLNKIDLLTDENREKITKLMDLYTSLDYQAIHVSAKSMEGLSTLKDSIKNHASVFSGQSGVGKSSIISHFIPDAEIKTGALSPAIEKGTHTTTTAKLFYLPEGGQIIDSPGIRELGIWHMSAEQIFHGFREFHPFFGGCKFANCSHFHEPGCALIAAQKRGDIIGERLISYQTMVKAIAEKMK